MNEVADIFDVREMSLEQRKQIFGFFIKELLDCRVDAKGHKWFHYWDDEAEVWVWVCGKCGYINIRTIYGDSIWIYPTDYWKALIVTDAFANPKKIIRKIIRTRRFRKFQRSIP